MNNFLLVGAGQLGSRHLQALAQYDAGDAAISVVDPSPAALAVARQRYEEVGASACVKSVGFHERIADIAPGVVDFCVIATSANCRLAVLRDVLANRKVRCLVLEKVLFQSVEQLDAAASLLAQHDVRAWVNCPRRQFSGYRQLREFLAGERGVSLHVTGHNWGLACNAIHFIDLWAFLGGHRHYELDCSGLQDSIASKRAGFREVVGTLSGRKGDAWFELEAVADGGPTSLRLHLESAQYSIDVEESAQRCTVIRKADGRVETLPFPILFQSQLTGRVAREILQTGETELTPFTESADLHRPLLAGLLEFFQRHDDAALTLCPIT